MNQSIRTSDPTIVDADLGRDLTAQLDRGLGVLRQGNPHRAAEILADALTLAHRLGDRRRIAEALSALGRALLALHRHDDARRVLCPAAALAREVGDPHAEKTALASLAVALGTLGRRPDALLNLDHALVLAARLGDRPHEAHLLRQSAAQHAALDDRDNALKYAAWSVDPMRRLADPRAPWFAHQLGRFVDATPPATPPPPAGPRPFPPRTPVESRLLGPTRVGAATDDLPAEPTSSRLPRWSSSSGPASRPTRTPLTR